MIPEEKKEGKKKEGVESVSVSWVKGFLVCKTALLTVCSSFAVLFNHRRLCCCKKCLLFFGFLVVCFTSKFDIDLI